MNATAHVCCPQTKNIINAVKKVCFRQ